MVLSLQSFLVQILYAPPGKRCIGQFHLPHAPVSTCSMHISERKVGKLDHEGLWQDQALLTFKSYEAVNEACKAVPLDWGNGRVLLQHS